MGRILEFCDGKFNGEREVLGENLRERYRWIWDWDGEAEVAKGLIGLQQRLESTE
jgi:hypothetical protein